ncbi:PIG-L family deacetylase [Pleomorphovibrio marinus]|uniref:PIG-L family deacetylase n=1 Tax=Pleomorphovibrio marinus TaxID=2164132 RepID=UPI000E0AA518|nr:PIG-L family deacetylase [Pleomorphovibrio marinus]
MRLKTKLLYCLYLFFVTYCFTGKVFSQSSSEVYHELLKLKETKRVLYLAAHPDDENTRLISYLANREHVQVAYLSLTRGDGGQNLIGKELGLELGMIRTQELLKARETDGGRQFFSRAIDFGFSKHPEETFNNWDREKLLSDVVWVIRKFQPDIMINRFNDTPGTTHGHHTASAILSLEAFEKAADPNEFPDQLQWVEPWQPRRVFWNAYSWQGQYDPEEGKSHHGFDVGEYNPLIGTTYTQIAADSRTMHKSQGFGATAPIGESNDFMELVKGEGFQDHPFEGIPNRWESLENGANLENSIDHILANFDFIHPLNSLPELLGLKASLEELDMEAEWLKEKIQLLEEIILMTIGVKAEFTVNKELSFPGDQVKVKLVVNNPTSTAVQVDTFHTLDQNETINQLISDNQAFTKEFGLEIPSEYPISQPYWLEDWPDGTLFKIEEQTKIGPPFNRPNIEGNLKVRIKGQEFHLKLPLKFKYNDQVDGEIQQPFTVVPEVSLSLSKDNLFLINKEEGELKVVVSFEDKIEKGQLVLEGLADSEYMVFERIVEEDKRRVTYILKVDSPEGEEKSQVTAKYILPNGKSFAQNTKRIIYDHIPNLTYFPPSTFNLVRLDLSISPQSIAYIPGAGDDMPGILSSLGYSVEVLENGNYELGKLKTYDTVIVGIRAFNVNQALAENVNELMAYVHEGGNLIVQYNTSSPLLTRRLGPYPFQISRDRVSVEEVPVKADFDAHEAMHSPNEILERDFEGWVQERGLYFPDKWDDQYTAPLAMSDPGESTKRGALLLADYGKGTFAYSGISWFRQLPAGVPGAIKIFVNLIEQAGNGN